MKTEFCNKSIRNASSLMYRTSGVSSSMESRLSGQLRILMEARLVVSSGDGSWAGDCSSSGGHMFAQSEQHMHIRADPPALQPLVPLAS
jgi:hypothetical protein